jgi:hypothetical protein
MRLPFAYAEGAASLRGVGWLAGGIAAVVLVLAVVWVLFVPAADWLAHHDVGSAKGAPLRTARDAARGRLLTLAAGLFALGALVYTARNFTLSREGQVTDRYTKAIEQLGSDKLDVRIGGIYALERVARDSAKRPPDRDGGRIRVRPRALARAVAAIRSLRPRTGTIDTARRPGRSYRGRARQCERVPQRGTWGTLTCGDKDPSCPVLGLPLVRRRPGAE